MFATKQTDLLQTFWAANLRVPRAGPSNKWPPVACKGKQGGPVGGRRALQASWTNKTSSERQFGRQKRNTNSKRGAHLDDATRLLAGACSGGGCRSRCRCCCCRFRLFIWSKLKDFCVLACI